MITDRPHVIVVHRWRESYARYTDYLDHATHSVTYVTTEIGVTGVPHQAADHRLVERTDDLTEVARAVDDLVATWGRPAGIVALKEDDLLVGAALRQQYGAPGPTVAELVPFRDKAEMYRRVGAAGVDVPPLAVVRTAEDVLARADRLGWPMILKPLSGSSSEGVHRVEGPEDLLGVCFESEMIAQQFVELPIYHVDGVFDGSEVAVMRASAYLNDCLSFRAGSVLGSVEEDNPDVLARVRRLAQDALAALTDRPSVFHLEMFVDAVTGRCRFLEVGARVGGAEVPLVWREVHDIDLMEIAFDLQLGRPLRRAAEPKVAQTGVAGWLLVPAPAARPCRITQSRSMLRTTPGPYAERVLDVGDVLPDADAYYEHVGGRFRFCGPSRAYVEQAIRAVSANFYVTGEELVTPVPSGSTSPRAGGDRAPALSALSALRP